MHRQTTRARRHMLGSITMGVLVTLLGGQDWAVLLQLRDAADLAARRHWHTACWRIG